jgi:hypothetical protein
MERLIPGKGAYLTLTKDSIDFLWEVIQEVWESYGEDGDELQDNKRGVEVLRRLHGSAAHWTETKDKFGHKMSKVLPFGEVEYRVTVVVRGDGSMAVDIRSWFKGD